MADIEALKDDPQGQLWEHLDDVRFVMLGSPKADQHMQPMSPQIDREAGTIWFYANQTSDLVQAVRQIDSHVHMCVTEKDYQACLRGRLTEYRDAAKIDQYWSPIVSAWFENGKTDPDLTMLCFTPHEAAIWASSANPITFTYEIAKANVSDGQPDVGDRANVNF